MVKKWTIIITIILFISINIFFSLYVERKNYKINYKGRRSHHHFKQNTLTTTLPKQYKKISGQELYLFKDYLLQNFEEEYGQEDFYLFDLDNPSNIDDNNYCKNIFEKFVYCLSEENFKNLKNSKCNKLFEKEIEELEKCTFDFNFDFDINDYTKRIEENIFYLNYSDTENNKNFNEEENDFETQEIIFENKEKDITFQEKRVYYMDMEDIEENIKSKENQNKDCVEYGLSLDEYLICTKYE
jgi:hypothetical protein